MSHIAQAIRAGQVKLDLTDKQHWPRFTPEDRLKIYGKCGQPCFAKRIQPIAKDGLKGFSTRIQENTDKIIADPKAYLKFPVCRVPAPKARKCAVSASGLLAANRRARLTKKHPDIVAATSKLIADLGTTATARENMEIRRVIVHENATPRADGKHLITIVYANGFKEQRPYTKRHILKKYGTFLPKTVYKRLSA